MSPTVTSLWKASRRHLGWLLPAAAMVAGVATIIISQSLHQRGTKNGNGPEPLLRGSVVQGVGDLDFMTPRRRES